MVGRPSIGRNIRWPVRLYLLSWARHRNLFLWFMGQEIWAHTYPRALFLSFFFSCFPTRYALKKFSSTNGSGLNFMGELFCAMHILGVQGQVWEQIQGQCKMNILWSVLNLGKTQVEILVKIKNLVAVQYPNCSSKFHDGTPLSCFLFLKTFAS